MSIKVIAINGVRGFPNLDDAKAALAQYVKHPSIINDLNPAYHVMRAKDIFPKQDLPDEFYVLQGSTYVNQLNELKGEEEDMIEPLHTITFEVEPPPVQE